jgi:transposase
VPTAYGNSYWSCSAGPRSRVYLEVQLAAVSQKSTIAESIRYGLKRWRGLVRFLDDGRIEMDTNSVERANRLIAMTKKNSLFAGHDEGAFNWACLASLIETAKLNRLNPHAYLADVLAKLVNGWPMKKLDELLPYAASRIMPGHLADTAVCKHVNECVSA